MLPLIVMHQFQFQHFANAAVHLDIWEPPCKTPALLTEHLTLGVVAKVVALHTLQQQFVSTL
jgi:hypothetical protein